MKLVFLATVLCAAVQASATSTLECTMTNTESGAYVQVQADLNNISEDGYVSDGVDVGPENYGFMLMLERHQKDVLVSAIFSENNHVQDEVASGDWEIDLEKAKGGDVVLQEDLRSQGRKVLDFTCRLLTKD